MKNKAAITTVTMIEELRKRNDMSYDDAKATVRSFLDIIREGILDGRNIKLTSVGTIESIIRQGGVGKNPKSGEKIVFPKRRSVKFTVSRGLKNELKEIPVDDYDDE